MTDSQRLIELTSAYGADNYAPLADVVLTSGHGSWVEDVEGNRYLDALSAYSALNFGHRHPDLIRAAHEQLDRLTLTSRAFHHDLLGPLSQRLCELTGYERFLPMNTGAEAVETAIKAARRWGYRARGLAGDSARIVVAEGNFHGRTTTIVGLSSDPDTRDDYGPFTPGFDLVPYGDADAMAGAIGPDTVAVLLEPIQGEAGVIIPPDGYLRAVRELCDDHGCLLLLDEIQSGLGRTGRLLAQRHHGVRADVTILGKALGGGIVPLSGIVADARIMDVFTPGSHGSTFGGNPLACAVGLAVLDLLDDPATWQHLSRLTSRFEQRMDELAATDAVAALRQCGLWVGLDLADESGAAFCQRLAANGVLAKDTHGRTIRLSPALTITADDLDLLCDRVATTLTSS